MADKFRHRLIPIHAGILITFALLPVWLRFKPSPGSFDPLYSVGFVLFWPMMWTVGWWLITGLPGFHELRQDRLRSWWAFTLLLLVCLAFLSWSWAYTREFRPEIVIGAALPFAMSALFALVVACVGPPAKWIVAVMVIGLLVNSVVAGWQVARQGPISDGFLGEFNINPANSGVGVVQSGNIRWLRPYGFLPHPNMLAGYLAVGCLGALAWVWSGKRARRWAGTAIFLIGLWALLLSFSRAAWLGFVAGGFAMLPLLLPHPSAFAGAKGIRAKIPALQRTFNTPALRQFLLTMGLAFLAVGFFTVLYHPFLAARTGAGSESIELRSVSDRLVYSDMAYQAITESPILGVGIGNFPWLASYQLALTDFDLRGQPVHHVLLSAWAELGLIGFVLTVGMVILGVEAVLRAVRKGNLTGHPYITPSPLINTDHIREGLKPSLTDNHFARVVMLAGVIALMVIGLLDHYPWTLMHFQVLWFALLAAAGKPD